MHLVVNGRSIEKVVIDPHFEISLPSRHPGVRQLWARIQQAQRATGCREVVCGLEPTGTSHPAVATFLEAPGATSCSSPAA